MRLFSLRTRQAVPIALDEAWAFFSDPRNLPAITPPSLGFEVTSELPDRMYAGLIISYRVRPLLGVPVTWVTEITHVDEPHHFVDEQRFGPYRFWHHQHHFRAIEGGTELLDIVHYAPPVSPTSVWVDRWMIAPKLKHIFEFRRQALERRFGTSPDAGQPVAR
jgi:ligand-binding SRPBCC domain-containing protein